MFCETLGTRIQTLYKTKAPNLNVPLWVHCCMEQQHIVADRISGFGENLCNSAFTEATCRKASAPAMLVFHFNLLEIKIIIIKKREIFIKLLCLAYERWIIALFSREAGCQGTLFKVIVLNTCKNYIKKKKFFYYLERKWERKWKQTDENST